MRSALFLVFVVLAGCTSRPRSEKPLDRDTFAVVYADMEATLWGVKRTTGDTAIVRRTADSVLAAHGITRTRYLATVRWFNDDGERWRNFYDSVGKNLEERARKWATVRDSTASRESVSAGR